MHQVETPLRKGVKLNYLWSNSGKMIWSETFLLSSGYILNNIKLHLSLARLCIFFQFGTTHAFRKTRYKVNNCRVIIFKSSMLILKNFLKHAFANIKIPALIF